MCQANILYEMLRSAKCPIKHTKLKNREVIEPYFI